jgi:hypothetical protein
MNRTIETPDRTNQPEGRERAFTLSRRSDRFTRSPKKARTKQQNRRRRSDGQEQIPNLQNSHGNAEPHPESIGKKALSVEEPAKNRADTYRATAITTHVKKIANAETISIYRCLS